MSAARVLAALTCATALGCATAAAAAFSDSFLSSSANWVQDTDIEHCSDGACFQARPDHCQYTPAGLRMNLNMSPCNKTSACGKAKWAACHLTNKNAMLYGTYSITARVAHNLKGNGVPKNVFCCLTPVYVSKPVHNEIVFCFPPSNSHTVHLSWWYSATMHQTSLNMNFDVTAGFHTYTAKWGPTYVKWYIDGNLVHTTSGNVNKHTIPWEAGKFRLILRPLTDKYAGDAVMEISKVTYDPSYA